jgi:NADH-quinone oxidoreductase subunit N
MLDHFEERYGMTHLKDFSGQGSKNWPAGIMLTLGLISLVGLPPAGGFMAKLLVFASLFDGYQEGGNSILLVLLFVALMGTAISLFFYLKIPFALYVQPARPEGTGTAKPMTYGILAGILALLLLILFFNPSLLTQWLNRINFAF